MTSPEKLGLAKAGSQRVILREPTNRSDAPALVGIVSKQYQLVQHEEVLTSALTWARETYGIEKPAIVPQLIDGGRKAVFRIDLGGVLQFSPDGFPIHLNLLVSNSVDGLRSLRVEMNWLRLVCSNGMMVGVALGQTRKAHRQGLGLGEAFSGLAEKIDQAKIDQQGVTEWAAHPVNLEKIRQLANGAVTKRWGRGAAARLWHICESGRDARTIPPYKTQLATDQNVRFTGTVPGAPQRAKTIFDVSQALSWIASHEKPFDTSASQQAEIGHILRLLLN
jgi:hypothetical protein